MPTGNARQELLDAAIAHVATRGLSDLSLRALAAELGTSHRMLIHHFGSKEGLWVAIVREVEQRQLKAIAELPMAADESPGQVLRRWWRHISDPSLWPNERLFFEVYGQALVGRPPATELLDGVVESWLGPTAALSQQFGLPPTEARSFARLGLAVTRGLLLDLLATGDRRGVDQAMELFIELVTARLEASSAPAKPRRRASTAGAGGAARRA